METPHDQDSNFNTSEFSTEMQKVFDHVLWDLKTKKNDFHQANKITHESIAKIESYLQANKDSNAANLLSQFYYQAGCDLNDNENLKDALGYFEKSFSAQQLCYNISGKLKDLHELGSCHFFLGRQLQNLGQQDQALFQYNQAYRMLTELCSLGLEDTVREDLDVVIQQIWEISDNHFEAY